MSNQMNRGFLYPVKEKKSEKAPNLTGKIFISPELAGHEIEIAGWTQTSKSGVKYISLSVKEPYRASEPQYSPPPQQAVNNASQGFQQPPDGFNDDIPF